MARKVWFQLVDEQRTITSADAIEQEISMVLQFWNAVKDVYRKSLLSGIDASALRVYKNMAAFSNRVGTLVDDRVGDQLPLRADAQIGSFGDKKQNVLIVQVPKVWFKLVAADTRTALAGEVCVPLAQKSSVKQLRDVEYTDWDAYNGDPKHEPLRADARILNLGKTLETALIVEVLGRTRVWEESKEVENPVKRPKGNVLTKWEWKVKESIYCLERSKLFFVSRDQASEQLLEFHRRKYYRAVSGVGQTWVVPLVDNVSGFGKSTFGQEYIRSCKQKWDNLPEVERREDSFLDVVRNCHTITIRFTPLNLMDENGDFDSSRAVRSFVRRIIHFFDAEYGFRLRAFDGASEAQLESGDVVRELIKEVGPLFIVIDDINMAFNTDTIDDVAISKRFAEFCDWILHPLFSIPKVFFLIAGRASFLNYVGPIPALHWRHAPFCFERPSLGLLGAPDIEKIIKNSYWDGNKKKTIQEHCGLDDNQVVDVSAQLRKTAFGHPRSLLTP